MNTMLLRKFQQASHVAAALAALTLVACGGAETKDDPMANAQPVEPTEPVAPPPPPLEQPAPAPQPVDPTPVAAPVADVAPVVESPLPKDPTPVKKDEPGDPKAAELPPDIKYTTSPAEALINDGVNSLKENNLFEARQKLQAATSTDPKSGTAWYNLALSQYRAGDVEEAMVSVAKAVEINPTYSRAVVLEAMLHIRRHEAAKAIQVCDQALVQRPLDVMLMSARARALVEDKQFQAAIDQCIKGIKLDQDNPELMRTLGEAYLALGREGLAKMALERAWSVYTGDAEAPPGASDEAKKLYDGKKTYDLRVKHGGGSWRGPGAEAIDKDAGMAQIYYLYGMMALKRDEIEGARDQFAKAVQTRPDYAEAWNNLGVCWIIAKKPQEAIESLTKALEIEPTLLAARVNLGNAWRISQDPQKAEKAKAEFERALKDDPRNPAIHFNLGILYLENPMQDAGTDEGRFQRALEYFKQYRELRGSDTNAKNPGSTEKKDPLDDYEGETKNLLKIEQDKRKAKEQGEKDAEESRKQKQEEERKKLEEEQKKAEEEQRKQDAERQAHPPEETPPPPGDTPPPPSDTPPPPADLPAPPSETPAPPPPRETVPAPAPEPAPAPAPEPAPPPPPADPAPAPAPDPEPAPPPPAGDDPPPPPPP